MTTCSVSALRFLEHITLDQASLSSTSAMVITLSSRQLAKTQNDWTLNKAALQKKSSSLKLYLFKTLVDFNNIFRSIPSAYSCAEALDIAQQSVICHSWLITFTIKLVLMTVSWLSLTLSVYSQPSFSPESKNLSIQMTLRPLSGIGVLFALVHQDKVPLSIALSDYNPTTEEWRDVSDS